MNGKFKRMLCAALALCLLCGCGQTAVGPEALGPGPAGRDEAGAGTLSGGGETVTVLAARFTPLPEGLAYASAQCLAGDTLWLGGMSGDGPALGSLSLDGDAAGELVYLPEGCEFVYAMCPAGGGVTVLAGTRPRLLRKANGQEDFADEIQGRLWLLGFDGRQFTSQVELQERYYGDSMVFKSMLELDGSFYIQCQNTVLRIGADGSEQARFELDREARTAHRCISSMLVHGGELLCAETSFFEPGTRLLRLDADSLSLLGAAELPEVRVTGLGPAEGGGLLACTGDGVMALDEALMPTDYAVIWKELYISDGWTRVDGLDGGDYLFYEPYQESVCRALWREEKPRKTVTVAADCGIDSLANAFNRSQSEYRLEVRCYNYYAEGELTRLQTEIGAGNWPDVFAFSQAGTLAQLRPESSLVDLYTLMDDECSKEDFVPRLIEAMEDRGALYWLPYKFLIHTLRAPEALIERPGISVDEALAAAREKNLAPIDQWVTREHLLSIYSAAAVQQFVDRDAGTCSFDSQEFADVLRLCGGMFAGEDVLADNGNIYTGPDDTPLLSYEMLESYTRLSVLPGVFGDFCFAGFPNLLGNGSIFDVSMKFAITAGAREKDGAWEFLKFASGERGQTAGNPDEFNANAAVLERNLQKLVAEGYMSIGGRDYGFTEDDAQKFRELLEGAQVLYGCDPTLEKIISDCAAVYFAGDKTAEQAAADIQARASIYVAERYG